MDACKAEGLHFSQGIGGAPSFVGHAVGGNGQARTIIAEAAVDEDLSVWVVTNDGEKLSPRFIGGKWAVRGNRDIAHPQFVRGFVFVFLAASAHVDYDFDAKVL